MLADQPGLFCIFARAKGAPLAESVVIASPFDKLRSEAIQGIT
jgi:hypothetical protein